MYYLFHIKIKNIKRFHFESGIILCLYIKDNSCEKKTIILFLNCYINLHIIRTYLIATHFNF